MARIWHKALIKIGGALKTGIKNGLETGFKHPLTWRNNKPPPK